MLSFVIMRREIITKFFSFFVLQLLIYLWVGGVFYKLGDGSERVGDVDSEVVHGEP